MKLLSAFASTLHGLSVLYEEAGTLVIDKPWMLSSEQRDARGESALQLVRREYPNAQLPHRLDRTACGVLVVATDRDALKLHNTAIQEKRWGPKLYVARLSTRRELEIGRREAYLRRRGKRAEVVRSGGKPSSLDLLYCARVSRDCVDVVLRLHTGRYHQIRAMMAREGAPVLGDLAYGGTKKNERPALCHDGRGANSEGPALCHAALGLPIDTRIDTSSDRPLVVQSSFPQQFFSQGATDFLRDFLHHHLGGGFVDDSSSGDDAPPRRVVLRDEDSSFVEPPSRR